MKSFLRGRVATAAATATVALLAAGIVLPPVPANANYKDPITIGFDNTTDC
jgi:hypothetical protein